MKIVYVSTASIPSKTANSIHVMKMCQAIAKNGHDVLLVAPMLPGNRVECDVYSYYGVENCFKVVFKRMPAIKGRLSLFALNTMIEVVRFKPDLVFGRFLHACAYASFLGYNVIYETHDPISNFSKSMKWLFYRMCNKAGFKSLIVISNALKSIITYEYPNIKNRIHVAHDGADTSVTSKVIHLHGRKKVLKVGYLGHLYKGRGVELILACAEVLKECDFHVVGGDDDDVRYWLEQTTTGNVYFYGFVSPSKVSAYRQACDVLLAPYANNVTISGGKGDTSTYMSPLKLFEYMSSRKAIIASDLPVLREILNESNSITVKPDLVEEWVGAITLLKDESIRNRLATNAYNDFIKNYTWGKRAKDIVSKMTSN